MSLITLLEKIVEKFEPIFKKINGGYFAILTTIFGIITILIASILFYMVEPFTIYSHWVSNLGGAVTNSGKSPNGSNIVFSIGLIIIGILSVPSVIYLTKLLLSGEQKAPWLINCAIFAGIATLIGLLLLAFFDIKSQPVMHTISGLIFFLGAVYMIFFFSLSIFFNSKISWIQGLLSLIIAGVGLIFLLTLLALLLQGMDPVSIVTDTGPRSTEARFWEWMFIFAFFVWFLDIGIYNLRQE